MDEKKRKRLEAKGWKIGDAEDFLELNKTEMAYIEMKLALSKALNEQRRLRKMTQRQLARKLNSSQSRIAKMEKGDPTVSIDLLIRSLLALETSKESLAKILTEQ